MYFVAGATLLVAAALPSSTLLQALLQVDMAALSWGPALFRTLLAAHGLALVGAGVWMRRERGRGPPVAHTTPGREPAVFADLGPGHWLLLSAITVVALGLRLWRLDSGLWMDEVFTLIEFVRLPFGEIVTSFPLQNQHMFYSVLARASVITFGESAWSLRLPAALFGALTVWPLFLLGRRLIGVSGAIAASALLAVSYHHVWFSQNARGYSGLLFFSILATWLWFEARDRQGWWWIGYALSLVGGLWMHQTMIFIVAAHGLVWLAQLGAAAWRRRRDIRGGAETNGGLAVWAPIGAWALAGTFTLQLYALSLPEFLASALHEVSLESEWTNPIWAIAESIRGLSIGWFGVAGVVGGAFVAGYGWFRILLRDPPTAALMVLPGVLGASTMLALGHNIWPRFFFFCAGFAILVVISGAMELPKLVLHPLRGRLASERVAAVAGVGIVVVMIVISAATVPRNYVLPKQDFVGAREFVEGRRGAGETVVAVGLAGVVYATYLAPEWVYAKKPVDLMESRRLSSAPLWLVYTSPIQMKAFHPEIWQAIEDHFDVVKVFHGSLGGGEVYVCRERQLEVRSPPGGASDASVVRVTRIEGS